ncbi:hypothetical protein GGD68_002150 [Paraburkholderia fungorum]|uniref:Uncharacterized protein n=1 Tax=Paraburkholderia fungorum TaxID=134537 RepID=A0AAW3UPR3_9BURK|nr:hypothetical protein [Paraburkholderia fungorum]MBB6200629.1 hypothetical protein [Paraburkholderia fungorum]
MLLIGNITVKPLNDIYPGFQAKRLRFPDRQFPPRLPSFTHPGHALLSYKSA